MKKFLTSILSVFSGGTDVSRFPPNVEGNQKTIQALIDNGSNIKKPHPLEHHFYCYSEESLKALMNKGTSLGYSAANIGDNVHEGKHYWYGDLIKETVLDLKIINIEDSIMLQLASEFNADYDGWGTPIIE